MRVFTGLIEEVGAVSRRSGSELAVVAHKVLDKLQLGDSVAVDGVCLTVVNVNAKGFVVQMSQETVEHTTLSSLKPGDAVNLERAMAVGDRFGGHFVLGHVDGVGRVLSVRQQGDFSLWTFRAPSEVAPYLIPKGSIAVDGISLTVVDPSGDTFGAAIIPATIQHTKLSALGAGAAVNLEADVLGKHVYHFMSRSGQGGLTLDTLARHGFA
jgi:riboflavin synthase